MAKRKEILRLRSLVVRGRAKKSSDAMIEPSFRLPDGVLWNVLSFWPPQRPTFSPGVDVPSGVTMGRGPGVFLPHATVRRLANAPPLDARTDDGTTKPGTVVRSCELDRKTDDGPRTLSGALANLEAARRSRALEPGGPKIDALAAGGLALVLSPRTTAAPGICPKIDPDPQTSSQLDRAL